MTHLNLSIWFRCISHFKDQNSLHFSAYFFILIADHMKLAKPPVSFPACIHNASTSVLYFEEYNVSTTWDFHVLYKCYQFNSTKKVTIHFLQLCEQIKYLPEWTSKIFTWTSSFVLSVWTMLRLLSISTFAYDCISTLSTEEYSYSNISPTHLQKTKTRTIISIIKATQKLTCGKVG